MTVLRLLAPPEVESNRATIAAWLAANEIDPSGVALAWISIETTRGETLIRYNAYKRNTNGQILCDPLHPGQPWTEELSSPLLADLDPRLPEPAQAQPDELPAQVQPCPCPENKPCYPQSTASLAPPFYRDHVFTRLYHAAASALTYCATQAALHELINHTAKRAVEDHIRRASSQAPHDDRPIYLIGNAIPGWPPEPADETEHGDGWTPPSGLPVLPPQDDACRQDHPAYDANTRLATPTGQCTRCGLLIQDDRGVWHAVAAAPAQDQPGG